MAEETYSAAECVKVVKKMLKWQALYEKRFGDMMLVGTNGLTPDDAIEIIKEVLKTGKPYTKYSEDEDSLT